MVLYGIGIISSHSDMFLVIWLIFFNFLGGSRGLLDPPRGLFWGKKVHYPLIIVSPTDIEILRWSNRVKIKPNNHLND